MAFYWDLKMFSLQYEIKTFALILFRRNFVRDNHLSSGRADNTDSLDSINNHSELVL